MACSLERARGASRSERDVVGLRPQTISRGVHRGGTRSKLRGQRRRGARRPLARATAPLHISIPRAQRCHRRELGARGETGCSRGDADAARPAPPAPRSSHMRGATITAPMPAERRTRAASTRRASSRKPRYRRVPRRSDGGKDELRALALAATGSASGGDDEQPATRWTFGDGPGPSRAPAVRVRSAPVIDVGSRGVLKIAP